MNTSAATSPYTAQGQASQQVGSSGPTETTAFPVVRDEDGKLSASHTAMAFFEEYARERPEMVALWAFGIGFVLGWKLKPW
ncbi:MAG: hypothetical protein KatS3mg111_3781 [Pirellulaceae bacterium]|nr:MAG: hypothetical protein KatS3mg111_3781 [Pirellulaceae bacterium]